MSIQPLHDRVLIERLEQEERSAGGIVIPDTAKEKPILGKVVAVGKGKRTDNGSMHPLDVKIGDTVVFGKYAGTEVKLNGSEYMIMREDDILAIVEK